MIRFNSSSPSPRRFSTTADSKIVVEKQDEYPVFEPIDNSDVEIEEGNKLYIHPIDTENPKLENIARVFNASVKELEHHIGNIPGGTKSEKVKNLIDGVFHSGFDVQLYVSNRSFPRKDRSVNKRIAVRTPRVHGDWLDTNLKLPISKTIIFEGTPYGWGKELSIGRMFLTAESSEKLPYEVDCSVRICDSGAEIIRPFLDSLIDQTASVYAHTARQLTLWEEYLDWSRKIAEHQIKGCKYIDVGYDRKLQRLVFTLISDSKEEFEKVRKSLRRDVQAYKNNYSSSEWKFQFNKDRQ